MTPFIVNKIKDNGTKITEIGIFLEDGECVTMSVTLYVKIVTALKTAMQGLSILSEKTGLTISQICILLKGEQK